MASVTPQTLKLTRVNRAVMVRVDGKQRKISIGKRTLSDANVFANKLTKLEDCLKTDSVPDAKLVNWINEQPLEIQSRIQKAGLTPYNSVSVNKATPSELVEWFLESKVDDLKPSTIKFYRDRLKRFVDWCDSKGIVDINKISSQHIENFKDVEIQHGERSSARTTIKRVKLLFKTAKKKGKIQSDPAASVTADTGSHRTDLIPIDAEWFPQLVDCTHNQDLKTALILARYAGCRVPSEVIPMTWQDFMSLEKGGELFVKNVKTIRTNEPIRRVPVFPVLRDYLTSLYVSRYGEANFDLPLNTDPIIMTSGLRDASRSYAQRITQTGTWDRWKEYWDQRRIEGTPFHVGPYDQPALNRQVPYMLGEPIPRIFQACRRSFANDLLTLNCPIQTAAYVLGHRVETLVKDYARVQERHRDWFEKNDADPFNRD